MIEFAMILRYPYRNGYFFLILKIPTELRKDSLISSLYFLYNKSIIKSNIYMGGFVYEEIKENTKFCAMPCNDYYCDPSSTTKYLCGQED